MIELYDVTAYDKMTVEDLENYRTNLKRLNTLYERKKKIETKLTGLKSVDLTKDKVTTGTGKRFSLPEFYTIALEDINANIKEFESHFAKVKPWYLSQLKRIENERQREVLYLFFMKLYKVSQIALLVFVVEPDLDVKLDYYEARVKEIKRAGLRNVQKLGAQVVKEYARQLVLDERVNL